MNEKNAVLRLQGTSTSINSEIHAINRYNREPDSHNVVLYKN
jgi:hypothetical protein